MSCSKIAVLLFALSFSLNSCLAAEPAKDGQRDAKAAKVKVGDTVWAQWKPNAWYHGKVDRLTDIGFKVNFDDGDTLMRCNRCSHIFCSGCNTRRGMWIACPKCLHIPKYGIFSTEQSYTVMGKIQSKKYHSIGEASSVQTT